MSLQEPLKILSLDGGGIRGLSSLLILEDIMEKIRDKNGLSHVPRPYEYFDLIGGTSTGGIIAIMLGRLQMTVDECIQAYRELARRAFSLKPRSKSPSRIKQKVASVLTSRSALDIPISSSSMFSAVCLEDAMKWLIKSFCAEVECKRLRDQGQSTVGTCPHENMLFRDKTCTKTVVLAMTRDNINALPTLFKTYDSSTAFESCTIWQVARATSAAVGLFESIKLGRDGIEFVDAAFGYNNPCEVLIQEARKQFPERHQMRILSIGTGIGDVVNIGDSPTSLISALRNMILSSKKVAHSLHNRFGDDGQYFRFDVDQGLKDITLSDWETASKVSAHTRNYLAENQRAVGKFVDFLFTRVFDSDEHRRQATGRIHFAVPFGRNKDFVGREGIMEQLLTTVPPTADADDCQKTAIVGLGGIGKTQVALEIAFRVREKYPDCSVFWVPAIDAVSFRNAYRNIGRLLAIDGIDDDKADVEELVKSALSHESAGSWLLIIDNADSPDIFSDSTNFADHLPFSRQGSLLFTSRNREFILELGISTHDVFDIEGMSEAEGFRLLESHLAKRLMSNREDTAKLLDVLGYLPLAIRQASAYMAKKQITTTRYLEYCRSSDKYMVELLSRDFEDKHRYKEAQNPIATTWLISFRQIEESDPLAANYLKFMCFLSEKAIPRSLFPADAWTLEAEDAIGTLKAYAFITEREDPDMYDIHRLVQLAMLNWLGQQGELEKWAVEVIEHIEESFPFPEYENKAIWITYLPHAVNVLKRKTIAENEQTSLLFKVGCSFGILGQNREAETMHQRVLETREKMLGPNHPDTLISVNHLGMALHDQGQYQKAETMYRRAMEEQEKTLGADHPSTLACLNNLSNVLGHQGQYERAEAMHRLALERREKVLGPDHPDTLSSVSNLGIVLKNQGQYEEAEAMHRRALDGREKVLGPGHPDTLKSISDLAVVLEYQGQYEEAEAMHRRSLEGREKVLGPGHPDTLISVNNMGLILERQEQYERAEAMHRRALDGREKVLGPGHPSTLASVNNLGKVLHRQGQYEEADSMYRRSLEGQEKTLGADHPDTLASLNNLGVVLLNQGRNEDAEMMHRRAFAGREKALGPDHPDTLTSASNLGLDLGSQGRYGEAETMHRRALEGRQRVLGPDHPDTLSSASNLGVDLDSQGQYEEAETMHRYAFEGRQKVLGPDNPDTLFSISSLGLVFYSQGRYREAEVMHQQALEGREKILGPDHPDTLSSISNLGIALSMQGKYELAEAMHRRALEGQERILGPDHPHTLCSVNNLSGVLHSRGKYKEAETMYRRVLEGQEKVLGPDHPETLISIYNLGNVLYCQEQYEGAEEMCRRAADGLAKTLGPDHPTTTRCVSSLARILENQRAVKELGDSIQMQRL